MCAPLCANTHMTVPHRFHQGLININKYASFQQYVLVPAEIAAKVIVYSCSRWSLIELIRPVDSRQYHFRASLHTSVGIGDCGGGVFMVTRTGR